MEPCQNFLDVYVVKKKQNAVVASAIEGVFTPPSVPGQTNLAFCCNAPVICICEPFKKTPVDTMIGQCGKRKCVEKGCRPRYKIKPQTYDYEIFRQVVKDQRARYGDDLMSSSTNGVVIVKESTVSSAASYEHLMDALSRAYVASKNCLDVFYFAKWLDRPDQFMTLDILPGGGRVVRTFNPYGFQALAFTRSGFGKIVSMYDPLENPVVCRPMSQLMNALVQRGILYAATTTPSLLQYDAMLTTLRYCSGNPEAPFSYLKTCESRGDTHPERPLNKRISADLSLFWVVIILFVAVICTWVLLKLGTLYARPYFVAISPTIMAAQKK
jgi:hypothetical protein